MDDNLKTCEYLLNKILRKRKCRAEGQSVEVYAAKDKAKEETG